MKFGQLILSRMAPEWAEAYSDYKVLKALLKPLKFMGKKFLNVNLPNSSSQKNQANLGFPKYTISNFSKADIEYLKSFNDKFEFMIRFEFDKITAFFKTKFLETMKKFRLFKINVAIIQNMKGDQYYDSSKGELKNCFHLFYKEISLLVDYYHINYEALRKIVKKQKKLCASFQTKLPFSAIKFDSFFNEKCFLVKNLPRLQKLKQDFETQYVDFFYSNNRKNEGRTELFKIAQGRLISHWENFYFGLFSGFTILLLWIILILGIKGDLDPDSDSQFNHVFHIFRGSLLLVLYIWLLGWNVYGWTQYHINYKNIFRFNYHFSTLSEILKRGASFTTIILLAFLWYVLIKEEMTSLSPFLYYQKEFCPLIGWFLLIIYMFYPSKKYFNGEGRFYMFKIMKSMLVSCFFVDFTLSWATDQIVSFVIPIRDLEYTMCYYVNKIFLNNNAEICLNQEKITISFVAAFIPFTLRIIQCLRAMYQKEHRFAFNVDFFNMIKYLISLITVFLSLFLSLFPTYTYFFYIWIFFAALSTCYSYYWDLKMDWGFLDPKAKYKYLRPQLSYTKVYFYYLAIGINLLFRFAWILSLSSAVVDKTMRKELYTFLLGFIEMTRRSIWNFFRVEKEHIANCGMFRVVENYKLPYENIKYNIDEKKLTYTEFENYDMTSALRKKISFKENSILVNNLEDLINKLKIPPKYTLEAVNKEIHEFKNFVDRGFQNCFIINEDDDKSSNLMIMGGGVKGNTFSTHKSNNEENYLLMENPSNINYDDTKLKKSLTKLMKESSWKEPIMESQDENEFKLQKKGNQNTKSKFNKNKTFSIELRKKK